MQNKKIGLYISDGVTSSTINVWLAHYKSGVVKNLNVLKADDFTVDKLKEYACIILPGGSGSKICNTLGVDRRSELIKYVEQGGSLLGVCAGAYAMSSGYEWSLSVLNFELIDKINAHRGESNLTFTLTEIGKKMLKVKDTDLNDVYYHNGPVWKTFDIIKENNSKILAVFKDDIYAFAGRRGEAPGTPAIIYDDYGLGKIIAISPHFEKSQGYEYVIKRVIQLLTQRKK
jgi:glutamine amidotransferase-like uncharacterized protein